MATVTENGRPPDLEGSVIALGLAYAALLVTLILWLA